MKILKSDLLWLFSVGNITVISLILCGSMFIQFFLGEFPCPLCMVQRMCMALCAAIQVYMLAIANKEGSFNCRALTTVCSFTLFTALAGASMSTRQILLHILPGDMGYGSAIFGLHLYTWGLLIFVAEIIAMAVTLAIVPEKFKPLSAKQQHISKLVVRFLMLVLTAFLLAAFVQEGFNWVLPSDPTENLLFSS